MESQSDLLGLSLKQRYFDQIAEDYFEDISRIYLNVILNLPATLLSTRLRPHFVPR